MASHISGGSPRNHKRSPMGISRVNSSARWYKMLFCDSTRPQLRLQAYRRHCPRPGRVATEAIKIMASITPPPPNRRNGGKSCRYTSRYLPGSPGRTRQSRASRPGGRGFGDGGGRAARPGRLYQRSLIFTHLMGRNGLLGRHGVKRDALRIGQAPQRTQEAISTHRRPRSFDRSPRCGLLVVGWHHGASRV